MNNIKKEFITIQRMLAHPPQTDKYNSLVFDCLEFLLNEGFELVFDRYGIKMNGEYIDGATIKEQILTAVFNILDNN